MSRGAIEPCAQRVLVDVHDLGLDRRARAALGDAQRQPAGAARVEREDGGVHLHARPGCRAPARGRRRPRARRRPCRRRPRRAGGRSRASTMAAAADRVSAAVVSAPSVPTTSGDEPGRRRLLGAHRARVGDAAPTLGRGGQHGERLHGPGRRRPPLRAPAARPRRARGRHCPSAPSGRRCPQPG